jgi:hypothetical protein
MSIIQTATAAMAGGAGNIIFVGPRVSFLSFRWLRNMTCRWLKVGLENSSGVTGVLTVVLAFFAALWLVLPTFSGGRQPQQVKLSTHNDRIDIQLDDEVQVRTMNLPPLYDDKGNPKQYTYAERQKLRGNLRETGYQSDYDSLKVGQIINLSLGKKASDAKKQDRGASGTKTVTVGKTKWIPMGELTGEITKLDGTTKQLTLTIESVSLPNTPRPDPALIKAVLGDRVGYKILILSKDPGQK